MVGNIAPRVIDFNSQPHKEADTVPLGLMCLFSISTHSLTRRLTERLHSWTKDYMYFNSQPHKEADKTGTCQKCDQYIFQLTASQGG